MRRALLAIPLGLACLACAPVAAQTPEPAEALVALIQIDGLTVFDSGVVTTASEGLHATGIILESPSYRLLVNSMTLTSGSDSMALDLEGISIRSRGADGYNVDITTLAMTLSGWPDRSVWSDGVCRYLEIIESVRMTGGVIRVPAPPGTLSEGAVRRISFASVGLEQSPDREPCSISGSLTAGALHAVTGNRQMYSAESINARLSLPASIDSARTQVSPGLIRLGVEMLSYASPGEVPAVGISRLDLSATAPARQWAGVVHLVRMAWGGTTSQVPAVRWMQAWNALHFLSPEIALQAPSVRLFLPGVMPAAMVANFGRAGLSTIIGSLRLDSTQEGGAQSAQLQASVNGVFDLDLNSTLRTIPYTTESLTLSHQTGANHFFDTAIASVEHLDLDYTDRGLDAISQAIIAVPAGRYAEEVGSLMISETGSQRRHDLSEIVATISYFFRMSTLHPSVRMSLLPAGGALLFPMEIDPETLSGPTLRERLSISATPSQVE